MSSIQILDNPVWNALHTTNQQLATGNEQAKYIKRDVGLFAGLRSNSVEELVSLKTLLPAGGAVILFVPNEITIPPTWKIKLKRDILQMIYNKKEVAIVDRNGIISLNDRHIPAMLELTHMTNPGPFFQRTIDLGNYEGIFDGDKLIAMTGRRLQPDPFIEVSAVCTHPLYTGKGYGAKLVKSQVGSILNESKTPFLHLYPDNTAALKLYEKIGFTVRKNMLVYFLESI